MPHCPNCGAEANETATFCTECGAKLKAEGGRQEITHYRPELYGEEWKPKRWKDWLGVAIVAPIQILGLIISFILLPGIPIFLIWLFFFA